MSELLHKRHNVSVLMYHIVCPVKYRRAVFTPEVEQVLKEICLAIEQRYEIRFLEIGTVGRYASEEQIRRYVQKQGKAKVYKKVFGRQLPLF